MDLINNIKQLFASDKTVKLTQAELVKFAKSKQGRKLTAELIQQTESLTKKDIGAWRNAWQVAISVDTPNRSMLYDIYTDCLVDLHLTGCISQRKGKTLCKAFVLVGKDGKKDEEATKLLQREWFYNFMNLALDSTYWGHSLIQFGDVISDEGGMRFENVELVPRKHVCQEYGVITPDPAGDWRAGIPYREGDFALWSIEVGKPKDLGLLLNCAPQCISKKNMLAFWDMFGEIFGAPMRVARTNTTDDKERARIENALDKMGAAFWALFPQDTEIEIKENKQTDSFNVYDRRVDRCNSELSKGVLTQTMTIDSGSSHSQSETHLEIFENLVEQDARIIECIINDKLLPLMAVHGFPVKGMEFKWDNTTTLSPSEKRELLRVLLEYYEIDPQYFVDEYNIAITGARKTKTEPNSFFG